MAHYGQCEELDKKAENIIRQDVLTNQSYLVEALAANAYEPTGIKGFALEDVANLYTDHSERIDELEELIEEAEYSEKYLAGDAEALKHAEELQRELDQLEEEQEEPQEVLEWWLVTPWLARKLEELGQPILDNDYGIWWGRTCSGQHMALDGTFQTIAENL